MMVVKQTGSVFGTAAGSLQNSSLESFQGSNKVGAIGEELSAQVLNSLAYKPGGPTVLHDLNIPGAASNIDHAIISSRRVLLVDSKRWAPGFYWTLSVSFRGLTRVKHADKKTLPMAVDRLSKRLDVKDELLKPLMVVWSSNLSKPMRLWALHPKGAHVVKGSGLEKYLRLHKMTRPANPNTVAALLPLVRR